MCKSLPPFYLSSYSKERILTIMANTATESKSLENSKSPAPLRWKGTWKFGALSPLMGICKFNFLVSSSYSSRLGADQRCSRQKNRKCKTLTAYASITTVGDQSWYQTEQGETVHGAKLIQRTNYEG